jgi:ribose transport system permease protein
MREGRPVSATATLARQNGYSRLRRLLAAAPGAVYLLVLMGALLSATRPEFLSTANLTNVALQVAVLVIVSLGMTLVILTEGIDLSLGAVLGLAGVVMGLVLVGGHPLPLALAAALAVGAVFGLANGTLVAWAGMPPFIVTLGMLGIAHTLAMVLTGGNSITGLPEQVRWFNEGTVLGVPVPIAATALLFVLTYLLLYHTRFGRYVFAIGGNRRALALSGVRVQAYLIGVYVFAGAMAAAASFVMTARMNAAHPTIALGLEFDAIAAVILGGTSFDRGRGGIVGTLAGAAAVGVLRNGLNLLGVSGEWQVAVIGLVIISGVAFDSIRGRT